MTHYTIVDSPIGKLTLTAERNALTGVLFARANGSATVDPGWTRDDAHPVLARAAEQLREYFAGKRTRFDLPLAPAGTAFQRGVWQALLAVPFGTTSTYGALASQVGKPKAARAVGGAVGDNPIAVIIPCHRIIGSDGSLTGFGGGLPRKTKLLQLEGVLPA